MKIVNLKFVKNFPGERGNEIRRLKLHLQCFISFKNFSEANMA